MEFLLEYIASNCVELGDFTLSSGQKSDYYIDIKKAITINKVLTKISEIMYMRLLLKTTYVAGVELGAVPLIVSISNLSYRIFNGQKGLPFIIIRKSKKDHGIQDRLVGRPGIDSGSITLIEDVVTTGGSVCDAYNYLVSQNFDVNQIITVVDRKMHSPEFKELIRKKVKFDYLFDIDTLLQFKSQKK